MRGAPGALALFNPSPLSEQDELATMFSTKMPYAPNRHLFIPLAIARKPQI